MASVGCGSAPSISTEKVNEFSATFTSYAEAVERVKAKLVGGFDPDKVRSILNELPPMGETLKISSELSRKILSDWGDSLTPDQALYKREALRTIDAALIEEIAAEERVHAGLADAIKVEIVKATLDDLGALKESLRADAANVKTGAMVERIENVGNAVASIPHPAAKAIGTGLTLFALVGGLLARKKKPQGGPDGIAR